MINEINTPWTISAKLFHDSDTGKPAGTEHWVLDKYGHEIACNEEEEVARRIVAAVNATAGWSTKALEDGTPEWLRGNYPQQRAEIDRLRQENAELREAAKEVAWYTGWDDGKMNDIPKIKRFITALAKNTADQTSDALEKKTAVQEPDELNHRRRENVELAKLLATAVHFAPSQDVQWVRDARAALEKHTAHPTATSAGSTAETSEQDQPADARRLIATAQKIADHFTPEAMLSDETGRLVRELKAALRDPHGWEPRGIITPAGSGIAKTSEEDHTGEPDPCDLGREWQEYQDWADQPTAYDP